MCSLTIRAWLFFLSLWKCTQEVLQCWSMSAQGIVRRHKPTLRWNSISLKVQLTFSFTASLFAFHFDSFLIYLRYIPGQKQRGKPQIKTSELTCHWRRSTSAASPQWSASTPAYLPEDHGTCRWTLWCHQTRSPAGQWSSHHYKQLVCLRHVAMVWTPESSSFPDLAGCADLYTNIKSHEVFVK